MKRPAFQFYPADWRKDAALQSCSLAAQGLWVNLICVMHECQPYGHLTINGQAMSSAQIGRLVGLTPKDCERLIAELRDALVCDFTAEGVMVSRRMVRDEKLRNVRAECGRLGGNPNLLGDKVKQTDNQKLTPSSSSSSSPSEIPPPTPSEAAQVAAQPPPTAAGGVCLALRKAGVPATNPQHPTLLALLGAGATEAELVALVPSAKGKGDPFAWLLAAAVKQRQRAANDAESMAKGPMSAPDPQRPAVSAAETAAYLAEQAKHKPAPPPPEVRARLLAMAGKAVGVAS